MWVRVIEENKLRVTDENKFMQPKLTGPHTPKHGVLRVLVRASFSSGRSWSRSQFQQMAREKHENGALCFRLCQRRLWKDLEHLQMSWAPNRAWRNAAALVWVQT